MLSIQANHYIFAGRISEISWNVDGRRNQNVEGILRSKMFISEDASTYDFNSQKFSQTTSFTAIAASTNSGQKRNTNQKNKKSVVKAKIQIYM